MISAPNRPLGVWILVACAIALAAQQIYKHIGYFSNPPIIGACEDEACFFFARYTVGISVAIMATSLGAWWGSRLLRTAFLAFLAALTFLLLHESYVGIRFVMEEYPNLLTTPLAKVRLGLAPAIQLGWLLLNCWYFLGPRTRALYDPQLQAATR